MPRRVALLGSINVGGNRLKMAELREALTDAGFANVETVVASGNVLLDDDGSPAEAERRIVEVLADRFSIETFAIVLDKAALEAALAENPFAGEGADKLVHVHFLTAQPSADQYARLLADHKGRGPERLAAGTRALHVDFVDGAGSSKLTGPFIERRLGCKGTARNLRSLQRIIEKMD